MSVDYIRISLTNFIKMRNNETVSFLHRNKYILNNLIKKIIYNNFIILNAFMRQFHLIK